jgi:hypothetical protein
MLEQHNPWLAPTDAIKWTDTATKQEKATLDHE